MFRLGSVIAALLAVLALAGCSSAAGTQKTASPRQVVALPKFNLDSPELFDDAFAPNKLRIVDPCATLRATDLSEYGEPRSDSPGDLGSCSNFMKDHNGRKFNVTLYFDNDAFDVGKHSIGGLPSEVESDGGGCLVRSAYRGGAGGVMAVRHGLQVQLDSELADPCSPAVQIMSEVIDVVRASPPVGTRAPGSLAADDPCATLDPAALAQATLGAPAQPSSDSMYDCDWPAGNGVGLRVAFDVGDLQPSAVPPVDLGGALGTVRPGSVPNSCQVEWEHRKNASAAGDSELVQVLVSNGANLPMDPCANAIGVARAVRAKLPTA